MHSPPDESEVHLWWCDLDSAARILDSARVLDPAERSAVARVVPERVRQRRGARRAVLRHLLGGYLGCDPSDVELTNTDGGKPLCPEAPRLAFNCSSSGSVAIYGFASDRRLGVDVEHRSDGEWKGLPITRYLSKREQEALATASDDRARDRRAAEAWVVKEAVAKAIGLGFSSSPTGIEVDHQRLRPHVRLTGQWAEHPSSDWVTELVEDGDSTIAAVAADRDWHTTVVLGWPEDALTAQAARAGEPSK